MSESETEQPGRLESLLFNLDLRSVALLLGIFVVIALLWGTFLMTPLKIFVVLLHEISHGLAAIVTGGDISRIEVNALQGGVCYTRGGNRFLTLTAGYLGSMLWGALILFIASRTRWDRTVSYVIGAFLIAVALLYVRPILSFGFLFSSGFGVGLTLMGWKLSRERNELVLKVIGLTSCLYAILDISDDVLQRPGIGSDADMLASHTGIPSVVWGVIWIGLAILVTGYFLLLSAQKTEDEPDPPQ